MILFGHSFGKYVLSVTEELDAERRLLSGQVILRRSQRN